MNNQPNLFTAERDVRAAILWRTEGGITLEDLEKSE